MLAHNKQALEEYTRRRLDDGIIKMNCDGAFLGCMGNAQCAACFSQIEEYDIDWASVASDTPCAEVVAFLKDESICANLSGDKLATTAFCQTFHSCAFWTNNKDDGGSGSDDEVWMDCGNLKECNWEGMHESFIGDGICHENLDGECYNSAVCNWDGGDCCKDTCKTREDAYVECGHDGYACRDPSSAYCDSEYTRDCKENNADDDATVFPTCSEGQGLYRLVMYDSFGDGWDGTRIQITPKDTSSSVVYEGELKDGSQGTEYICLQKSSTCYHVELTGGTWGKEVSWDVRGFSEGSQAIAGGGAPMSCDFSTGNGEACVSTCFGRPDVDPTNDPDYKDFKEIYKCIEKSCVIQVGVCEKDPNCVDCLAEEVDEHCYSIASFNAVLDCTMCQCTDKKGTDFCINKASPGIVIPGKGKEQKSQECTPGEILKGGTAVMEFTKCTDFDTIGVMVTDFDQNNFGDLDLFEACAHGFADKTDHGGKTALECLQILVDAKNGNMQDESSGKVNADTVSALARFVYDDGESFCDCSKRASEACPLCPSFKHFKTLLYESLDACMALDEIDCPAWSEFYEGCKTKIEDAFGAIDFNGKPEQCNYVTTGCDGVGPFPAFRRLDCNKEIKSSAWDFHNNYMSACSAGPSAPVPTPVAPPPVAPYSAPYPAPVPSGSKPYVPSDEPEDDTGKKKYVPSDEKGKNKHHFRNFALLFLVCCGAYYYYKRRQDGFRFNAYGMMQRSFGGDDGIYHGLAMDASTSFEPAHLPPPPSAMGGSYYNEY